MSTPARARSREVKVQMERGQPRAGDNRTLTVGSQMAAILVTIAQSIILVDSLADARSAGQQGTTPNSASAQSSPSPRILSTMTINPREHHRTPGMMNSWDAEEYMRQLKVRKAKARGPSLTARPRGRAHQLQSPQDKTTTKWAARKISS